MTSGDIILTTDSVYSIEYCVDIVDGICVQKYFVSSLVKSEIVEMGTEVLLYAGIMLSFIFVIWFLLRGVFYLFYKKYKKND